MRVFTKSTSKSENKSRKNNTSTTTHAFSGVRYFFLQGWLQLIFTRIFFKVLLVGLLFCTILVPRYGKPCMLNF